MADWAWFGDRARKDMDAKIALQMGRFAANLRPILEDYTPVRSGDMRKSWDLDLRNSSMELVITNHMPYWIYVEMGTSRMAARAPLRRALATIAALSGTKLTGSFAAPHAKILRRRTAYTATFGGRQYRITHRSSGGQYRARVQPV